MQEPPQIPSPDSQDSRMVQTLDALLPREVAHRAEDVGVAKANLDTMSLLLLAVLAGAFIALGAVFATTVGAGTGLPFGVGRLLAGTVFSLGLILVLVGGAELFTGNNLIVMAWMAGKIGPREVLRNWVLVYLGNLAGALGTVALVWLSGQYAFGEGAVGRAALAIATAKVQFGFVQAVALGTLCNALVCLAVWLTLAARTVTDKVLAIVFPISAFVAAGFEHSVANMYFIPIGLLIQADAAFLASAGIAPSPALSWSSFLLHNLLPVTLGNLIGGVVLVGGVYWIIYRRH